MAATRNPMAKPVHEPARHRASFFLIRGRAKSIRRVQITASQSSRWDFEHYFEVVVQLDDLQRAVVCCRTLPSAWQDHTTLDQPCRVQAMFLKAVKSDGPKSPPAESQTAELQPAESQTPTFQPLFVAQRIAWLPDHQNSKMGIGPDQLLLSQLGMDQGLFDLVRRRNGLPISGSERACFYSLLRAVERASAQQLTEGSKQLELQSLLQTPARFHGDLFHTAGSVRRITRVAVKEEDIQQLYGIDHYYQLDVLLSLSDTEIRISGDSDQAGPVYDISFPLTCCVRSVPTAWQSLVGKEDINVTGVFDGFFYKVWTYSNPYVGSFDPRNRQLSPMLMTSEPRIVVVRQSSRSGVGLAVGIGFLVLLGLLWALVWRVHRSDAAYARILRRREPSAERPDFKRFPPSQP